MSDDNGYGKVDGPRPDLAKAIETDPFESLLGVCRVLGLRYEVTQHGDRWTAKLTPTGHWPADFYAYTGERHGKQASFSVIGATDRLYALRTCLTMVWQSLFDNCRHWRSMVETHPKYQDWFPKPVPTGEKP
jgi:hypothetical protein